MRIVVVSFEGSGKEYEYYTDINLITGGTYKIVADKITDYSTPIKVLGYRRFPKFNGQIRVITDATILVAPPRPADPIKKVIFNEVKRTTVVIWEDGTVTKVKCSSKDEWNKETGLAMCFMKRVYHNRGCFNELLKHYCHEDQEVTDK